MSSIRREGICLDAEYVAVSHFSDPDELLKNPFLAGGIRDALILFDRDGGFTEVQKAVIGQFMEPKWLKARLSSLVPDIDRNGKEFTVAVKEGNEVEMCRASIFALWTLCDALPIFTFLDKHFSVNT